MDVLNLGDSTAPLRWQTEKDLGTATTRLSSGLRINSAADDPSGLAISENLRSLANGYGQGAHNVDDAVNALTVADGALQSVANLLQRIRTLTVEANSDITSTQDRENIQAEIDQALQQINSISQKTSFNGRHLLDGSLANPMPAQPPSVTQLLTPADPSTGASNDQVANAGGTVPPQPGPLISNVTTGTSSTPGYNAPSAMLILSITGVDPATGGIIVHSEVYSPDPNFGPAVITDTVVPANSGPIPGIQIPDGNGTQIAVTFDLANLTSADVGTSIAYMLNSGQPATSRGNALQVQYGASEGATTTVSMNAVSTSALGISGLTVLPPEVTAIAVGVTPVGPDRSSQLSATYAEYKVDTAIQQVTGQRAALGAQIVALQSGASNDLVAQNSLTASESTIRDVSIASEVTQFTKLQITSQFQTQVLQQSNQMAKMIYQLLTSNL
jgi:flagellin